MKREKQVSRRQFLFFGTLAGGGLMLSELGCAPNLKPAESTQPGGSAVPPKRRRNIAPPNLPKLQDATLLEVVEQELQVKNCHPFYRESDENRAVAFTMSGHVKSPTSEFKQPLKKVKVGVFLNDLLPKIEFTVSGVTYTLSMSGPTPPDKLLVGLSLVEILSQLKQYCILVESGGSKTKYTVSGLPLFDKGCHKGTESPYTAIGDQRLDQVSDALEYMSITIVDSCAPSLNALATAPYCISYNKIRRE